eukprot:gene12178-3586_t
MDSLSNQAAQLGLRSATPPSSTNQGQVPPAQQYPLQPPHQPPYPTQYPPLHQNPQLPMYHQQGPGFPQYHVPMTQTTYPSYPPMYIPQSNPFTSPGPSSARVLPLRAPANDDNPEEHLSGPPREFTTKRFTTKRPEFTFSQLKKSRQLELATSLTRGKYKKEKGEVARLVSWLTRGDGKDLVLFGTNRIEASAQEMFKAFQRWQRKGKASEQGDSDTELSVPDEVVDESSEEWNSEHEKEMRRLVR